VRQVLVSSPKQLAIGQEEMASIIEPFRLEKTSKIIVQLSTQSHQAY